MTPLQVNIIMGIEDSRLLSHIDKLEGFDNLSEGERLTLHYLYERLDILTMPPVEPIPRA